MRAGKSLSVSSADSRRLKALAHDRNAPQKHVWRAEIVLADRRWRRHERDHAANRQVQDLRMALAGALYRGGVRRAAPRQDASLAHQAAWAAEAAERVVALTLGEPPGETTHWTGALMAKAAGLSVSSVQRIWRAHGLATAPGAPVQAFERPALRRQIARRRRALCRSARARHRSVGRRKEPNSGARPHAARTAAEEGPRRNHDPRLQAAWHDDTVRRAECPRRHGDRPQHAAPSPSGVHPLPQRHRERRFPPERRSTPSSTTTPPTSIPRCADGLHGIPRWTFHFTPTSASWLNAVEGFFATLTKRRLKRGVFRSVVDLQAAINRFLEEHNQQSKPFTWTADPGQDHRRRQTRAPNVRFDPLAFRLDQSAGPIAAFSQVSVNIQRSFFQSRSRQRRLEAACALRIRVWVSVRIKFARLSPRRCCASSEVALVSIHMGHGPTRLFYGPKTASSV